ncbi:MAG: arylesterase [Gammaproteobacteria bacterium]|nr:arylesterase [Gammaproteobacteria bacterium]
MTTDVGAFRFKSKSSGTVPRRLLAVVATLLMLAMPLTPANSTKALSSAAVHIVAFGDSLVAGYGLPAGADFAARLQKALTKAGYHVKVTNSGVSGDTTSGGLARFDWAVPDDADAVILELGANDMLRGISPDIARANLEKILSKLSQRNTPVLIAGMRSLANWGEDYARKFNGIFPALAKKYDALLYPFFLDGVVEKPALKLDDGLHPNGKGVDEIVRRILPRVQDLIARAKSK